MTKAELIRRVNLLYDLAKKKQGRHVDPKVREHEQALIKWAVDHACNVIAFALERGEKVVLQNLGTFTVEQSKPRKRHDVRTGLTVDRPGRRRVKFKGAEQLVDSIDKKAAAEAQERQQPSAAGGAFT
jgi:nucleoid DNA-binding protein